MVLTLVLTYDICDICDRLCGHMLQTNRFILCTIKITRYLAGIATICVFAFVYTTTWTSAW